MRRLRPLHRIGSVGRALVRHPGIAIALAILCLAASIGFVADTVYGRQAKALDTAIDRLNNRSTVLDRLDAAEEDSACQARINGTFFALIGRGSLTNDPAERAQIAQRLRPVVDRLERIDPDRPQTARELCRDPVFSDPGAIPPGG